MQDLFHFEQTGVGENGRILGELRATGIRPGFAERFELAGLSMPQGIFLGQRI
jgi:pilus assembly protein CpaF